MAHPNIPNIHELSKGTILELLTDIFQKASARSAKRRKQNCNDFCVGIYIQKPPPYINYRVFQVAGENKLTSHPKGWCTSSSHRYDATVVFFVQSRPAPMRLSPSTFTRMSSLAWGTHQKKALETGLYNSDYFPTVNQGLFNQPHMKAKIQWHFNRKKTKKATLN